MSLSTKQRNSLPESDFAVPGKRQLPIHDETHVRLAHDMINKTHGLTPEEKSSAEHRILERAHKLGIDTSEWNANFGDTEQAEGEPIHIISAMRLEGMSIELPYIKNHPNKLPFSGILTRLDQPSDNALNGSNGKRVILTTAAAEKALPSLLGMSIDFTEDLDGHNPRNKIGVITGATIQGNAVHIEGFFYQADYPTEVKNIQANKSHLGFSYEIQGIHVRSMNDDPLVIDSCIFTGAAVLYKDCAAYESTSLAANAVKPESKFMSTKDENDVKVMDLIKSLSEQVSKLEEAQKKDQRQEGMHAGNIMHLVKPHSDKLRAAADSMCAAGMGMHYKGGHVHVLNHMADQMDSDAAMGKMPHVYQTQDWYGASKENTQDSTAVKDLKASLEAITTQLADIKKSQFVNAAEPERKTLSATTQSLLQKMSLKASGDDESLSVRDLDAAISKVGNLNMAQRMALKMEVANAGKLSN